MVVSSTRARPDLEAFERSMRLELPVVVKELKNVLGGRLVAYIAGVGETRAVNEWIEGARKPRGAVESRLRLALHLALAIGEHDSAGVVRAWFQGLNPQLDDRSPARLLREADIDEVGPQLVAALRAFLAGG